MITKTPFKANKKNPSQNQRKLNHKAMILMGLMMTRGKLLKNKRKAKTMTEILLKLVMTKAIKVWLLNPSWDRSRHQLLRNMLYRRDKTWLRLKIYPSSMFGVSGTFLSLIESEISSDTLQITNLVFS
jgi:hypothetical protein